MAHAELRVEGAPELARDLDRVADHLGDLSEPGRQAAERVAGRARAGAPRDTGFLAGSIRASSLSQVAQIEAGATYAPFVQWGTKHMAAQPFLTDALEAEESSVVDTYTDHVQHLLDRVEGT